MNKVVLIVVIVLLVIGVVGFLLKIKADADYAALLEKNSYIFAEGKIILASACRSVSLGTNCTAFAEKSYDQYADTVTQCGVKFNAYSAKPQFVKCLVDNGVTFP